MNSTKLVVNEYTSTNARVYLLGPCTNATDSALTQRSVLISWHSPSLRAQSKTSGEVFYFRWWQRFREHVGHHVFSWAINEPDDALFDNPTNKMKTNVNILLRAWYWLSWASAMADWLLQSIVATSLKEPKTSVRRLRSHSASFTLCIATMYLLSVGTMRQSPASAYAYCIEKYWYLSFNMPFLFDRSQVSVL